MKNNDTVVPAKAGTHGEVAGRMTSAWIPAFAGMTGERAALTGQETR